ncbi:MAG TPA: glutamine synthetase type III [Clostridiales bacterium]|nr:glutamine synthetase type III [Clostridiales bacterium]
MANVNVPELFGSMVFDEATMTERLPKETFKALKNTIKNGDPLDINVANIVANAMKDWALEKGATHYTHWFQPMTGITAEKHDSFINPTDDGRVIMEFSGKELIKGEPDASSFPSGGIRATFEARGYTAWDPTSYAFVKDETLCIPTAFCSYTGESLDKKTPLLRSMERINTEALRILRLFGDTETTRVNTTVGPEQEYFLIDKDMFDQRKDLQFTGRTLFGAKAPKGQELEDHYFGTIKPRVLSFMQELDRELWKFGILAKTRHNEVAPSQHELAPIFTTTNLATDHNQLTMEVMKKVAKKHGLVCLLHEKPFAGVNGSGKHNNWSLSTNTGKNLLSPSKTPMKNTQFQLFLAAIIKGVDEYQDLLRISVASAGNDHRLGANEAPPAIISIFLGEDLSKVMEAVACGDTEYTDDIMGRMGMGVDVLPDIKKDTTDRNRTSPFAFTGNKFEFRMLGSALNIACPNIMLNTFIADELKQFADELEGSENFDADVKKLIGKTYNEHKRIVFNGDNYSEEWAKEAKKRGLLNLRTMADALPHYIDAKNIKLFTENNVFSEREMYSRYEIQLEEYSKVLNIEALTMLDMAKRDIVPAVTGYVRELADTANSKKALSADINCDAEIQLVTNLSNLTSCFVKKIDALEKALLKSKDITEPQALADFYRDEVFGAMQELRAVGDEMEISTSSEYWPYPSYGELLFGV